jgi:hypothetical protein
MVGAGRGRRSGLSFAGLGRRFAAATLVVLTGLLSPISLVTEWAWSQASDTEAFVATYAPLARAPQVQQLATEKMSAAILAKLGRIGQNHQVQQLTTEAVTTLVTSQAFVDIWTQGLRASHAQLRSLLAAEPGSLEVNQGALQLQLAPFSDAVRQRLIQAQIPFADQLPTINAAITLIEIDPQLVAQTRDGYRIVEVAAAWSPWLALLAGVGAVLSWRTKRGGLIATGAAIALGTVALVVAGLFALGALPGLVEPALRSVVALLAHTATGPLLSPLMGLAVTSAVLLFTGVLSQRPAPTPIAATSWWLSAPPG